MKRVKKRDVPLKLQDFKLIQHASPLEPEPDHLLVQIPFLFRRVPRRIHRHLALIATAIEDSQLSSTRRRRPLDTPNLHPILTHLLHLHVIQVGLDIAVEVHVPLQLVQELALDRVRGDDAFAAFVLGDDAGAVGGDLCDAEDEVVQGGERVLVEVGEVGARHVGGAFDQVAGDEGAGEGVEVGGAPRVPVPGCSYHLDAVSTEQSR